MPVEGRTFPVQAIISYMLPGHPCPLITRAEPGHRFVHGGINSVYLRLYPRLEIGSRWSSSLAAVAMGNR